MDKKRGIVIIISLILFLGVVDAAWILSYQKTITGNVAGGKFFTISKEFSDEISLNTSEGPDSESETMEISVTKDRNVEISLILTKIPTFEGECDDYEDDCRIFITHIYSGTENVLLNRTAPIKSKSTKDFILFEGENIIKYKIECVEDSCPQDIISNVSIEGV